MLTIGEAGEGTERLSCRAVAPLGRASPVAAACETEAGFLLYRVSLGAERSAEKIPIPATPFCTMVGCCGCLDAAGVAGVGVLLGAGALLEAAGVATEGVTALGTAL